MGATIKEIAEAAGVSIGTVDRVLNQRGHVSPEKQERILNICRQLNYGQNIVGRAMSLQKKDNRVAVIVNSPDHSYFSQRVMEGFEAIQREIVDYNITFDYMLLQDNTSEEMLRLLEQVEAGGYVGVIIKPYNSIKVNYQLNRIVQKGIPVIFCTSDIPNSKRLCYVGQNHRKDGRLMAGMLCRICHEPIRAVIFVAPTTTTARRTRVEGFLDCMLERRSDFTINSICELPKGREAVTREMITVLENHPDANVVYLNPENIDVCIDALEQYGRFHGITCCFGDRNKVEKYLRSGQLDFFIEESPYEHGYRAGQAMFRRILNGNDQGMNDIIISGQIGITEIYDD